MEEKVDVLTMEAPSDSFCDLLEEDIFGDFDGTWPVMWSLGRGELWRDDERRDAARTLTSC